MKKAKILLCFIVVSAILFSISAHGLTQLNNASEISTNTLQDRIENICKDIPENAFGGIYLEDEKTIVVNVVENAFIKSNYASEKRNGITTIYKPVKYSLAELEEIKSQLEPYMTEYDMATLDANDVTNKLDIELYKPNENVFSFVSGYIDSEYINISVLPEGSHIDRTIAAAPPENNSDVIGLNADVTGTLGTIYPGNVIKIGANNVYCTVGPRYSSTKFYTCGHAPCEYFNRTQTVYCTHPIRGLIQIGQTGNVVFGSSGDHCMVTVSGLNYTLPSSNGFAVGAGTYTYGSGVVGTSVEMHGGYSGVTRGSITAINQTVSYSDGTTVGNLSKANYTCKSGDSGAAVFSNNIVNTTGKCYGIQSGGSNYNSSGEYYAVSYFYAF